jgi:hypothetical protein
MQDPGILQMLAAMDSETGRYVAAVTNAQMALTLARQQLNSALVKSLEANLMRYESQATTGGPR